jgi:Na+/H+ antiporter NhaC
MQFLICLFFGIWHLVLWYNIDLQQIAIALIGFYQIPCIFEASNGNRTPIYSMKKAYDKRGFITASCLLFFLLLLQAYPARAVEPAISAPDRVFGTTEAEITVQALNQKGYVDSTFDGFMLFYSNDRVDTLFLAGGIAKYSTGIQGLTRLKVEYPESGATVETTIRQYPGILTVVPALLAIFLALWLRQVIVALLAGCLTGIWIYNGAGLIAAGQAILLFPAQYLPDVLSRPSHVSVIVFSLFIGAMVNIISKNGGMQGVVKVLSRYASNARRTRLVTWFSGMLIFFDDYANTLIVGNSMRPLTDRFRISREKLAYIVDSTAAPLAAIAFITTWIGAQLGYLSEAIDTTGIELSATDLFLHSLKYAHYPVFTLFLVFLVSYTGRDFASMHRAELRARKVSAPESDVSYTGGSWLQAVVPVLVLIVGVLSGLFYTGIAELSKDDPAWNITDIALILGNSDAYKALLWGSFTALITAVALTLSAKLLSVKKLADVAIEGMTGIFGALMILVLAWTLAMISADLQTASYLAGIMEDRVPVLLLPAGIFVLSAAVSFATGSSWGTMALLYPLFLPVIYSLGMDYGQGETFTLELFFQVVAAILGGSVFGDHCSPLSDTSILSSMASECDHVSHVRTQLPYGLLAGIVAVLAGSLAINYLGFTWWMSYAAGIAMISGALFYWGKVNG